MTCTHDGDGEIMLLNTQQHLTLVHWPTGWLSVQWYILSLLHNKLTRFVHRNLQWFSGRTTWGTRPNLEWFMENKPV